MSVFAKLSRTLGIFHSRASEVLSSRQTFEFPNNLGTRSRHGLSCQSSLWFSQLGRGQRTTARTSFAAYVNLVTQDDRCRADPVLLQSNYSSWKVTISAFKQPRLSRLKRLRATWKRTGHGNVAHACFSRCWRDSSSLHGRKIVTKPWTETASKSVAMHFVGVCTNAIPFTKTPCKITFNDVAKIG